MIDMKQDKVRLAMIGLGGMGSSHLKYILETPNVELTAVCDVDEARVKAAAEKANCKAYTDHKKLLEDKVADAVMIITPHYFHTTIGIDALKSGHHVLVEKPISVHKRDCERLIDAHKKNPKLVFAAMFNVRTYPPFMKVKEMVDNGELGELIRVNWIVTDWFRTESYYASGTWRATWKGEGGGVLLNQCPHQLDLLQWICGMPKKITSFCYLGKRHNIEVEDEVTAYLEYKNGATGVFIASTGEAPGTNRLEIAGEKGKIVLEEGELTFYQNEVTVSDQLKNSPGGFTKPPLRKVTFPDIKPFEATSHSMIFQNFINTILNDEKLIAPAEEGIKSVEIGNAMLYSGLTGKPVELPMDSKVYEKYLQKLIDESTFVKETKKKRIIDFQESFKK